MERLSLALGYGVNDRMTGYTTGSRHFSPGPHLTTSGYISDCHNWGYYWHSVCRGHGCYKHPRMHRITPTAMNYLQPQMSTVQKLKTHGERL